jgi:enamine deaminase RidA (YjgF/YER057c/UK114 family)
MNQLLSTTILQNLSSLNIELPKPAKVAGNYAAYVEQNGVLAISGQTCKVNGVLIHTGPIGIETHEKSIIDGQDAAKICALNLLAQVGAACAGDWDRLERCLKLTIFVNCTSAFTAHPDVANGASDILVKLLGDRGVHTRAAVGAVSLPGGSTVEIDGLFTLR